MFKYEKLFGLDVGVWLCDNIIATSMKLLYIEPG